MASKRTASRRLAPSRSYYTPTGQSLIIRPTQPGDADAVADRLKGSDIAEIRLLFGHDANIKKKVRQSYHGSDVCWTLEYEKIPEMIFGVQAHNKHFGWVWMVSTPVIQERFPKLFFRESKVILHSWLLKYRPVLGNYVSTENIVTIRWLKRLGFKFLRTVHLGPHKQPFYEFLISCASRK